MLINIRPYVNEWDKVERSMTRRPKVGESWENSQYALYGRRLCQMNDTASSDVISDHGFLGFNGLAARCF